MAPSTCLLYAAAATRRRSFYLQVIPLLRSSPPVRWINRICGGLFALMGTLLLLTRRSA